MKDVMYCKHIAANCYRNYTARSSINDNYKSSAIHHAGKKLMLKFAGLAIIASMLYIPILTYQKGSHLPQAFAAIEKPYYN